MASFRYRFQSSSEHVVITISPEDFNVLWAIEYRYRAPSVSLASLQTVMTTETLPGTGSTTLYLSKRLKSPRRIFPDIHSVPGATKECSGEDLLSDLDPLFSAFERHREETEVEYGIPPIVVQHSGAQPLIGRTPYWSGFITGVLFADDESPPYTLLSTFGIMEQIQHDPETGAQTMRNSIRPSNAIRTRNLGEITIYKRAQSQSRLFSEIQKFHAFLRSNQHDVVMVSSEGFDLS